MVFGLPLPPLPKISVISFDFCCLSSHAIDDTHLQLLIYHYVVVVVVISMVLIFLTSNEVVNSERN